MWEFTREVWDFSQAAGQKGEASPQKRLLQVFVGMALALLDDPLQHESNLEAGVLTSGDAAIERGILSTRRRSVGLWVCRSVGQ